MLRAQITILAVAALALVATADDSNAQTTPLPPATAAKDLALILQRLKAQYAVGGDSQARKNRQSPSPGEV